MEELGGKLLEAVSRSFYLTIRLLPEPLRGPLSLGYLLARAMDTVADSPAESVPTATRLEHLRAMVEMIKYGTDPAALRPIQRDLAPLQKHAGERALLEKLDRCLGWLESLTPAADRWDLQRALTRIAYGQELDLLRFGGSAEGEKTEVRALQNAQELDDYTYYVAGSAGELWTRLCSRHLPGFATLPQEEMLRLGRAFGQGLQLVNVLRDVPGDLRLGRCYLPADELATAGITSPANLLQERERVQPILRRWRLRAAERLDDAWRYVRALRGKKLRYACTLPVLLGIRTLALLAQAPALAEEKPVKVSRGGLRNIMFTAGIGMVAPPLTEAFYRRARRQAAA
ncbi:MAG: squalene/phytoene synthase family protein [Verrucomicrobia bacterium]|nr:squalene/phytoene synthase family protein [Verrucomicrobiota bacterium]